MLFIDLSGQQVLLSSNGETLLVDRKRIEEDFAPALLNLYTKHGGDSIYVVQGPGSFTVIRIGVLLINAFVMLHAPQMKLYTLSKLDFYREVSKLEPTLAVSYLFFIGQRKNVWQVGYTSHDEKHNQKYNKKHDQKENNQKENNQNTPYTPQILSKTAVADLEGTYVTDCDDVSIDHDHCMLISPTQVQNDTIFLQHGQQSFAIPLLVIEREQQSMLQPIYLIQPNIG